MTKNMAKASKLMSVYNINTTLPINRYNVGTKVHDKQVLFHKCTSRIRFVFGGNRCGKTECGAVETVWIATATHPFRKNLHDSEGWVVSVSKAVQRDVAQRKLLRFLPKQYIKSIVMLSGSKDQSEYGIIDYIIINNELGGESRIYFKNYEQSREKFQGTSLDYVWFDEEPPQDIYNECRMRIMDRGGMIYCTMTPLKGLTFIYDEIIINKFNNKEVWYICMQWEDNPFLKTKEIAFMKKSMSDDELESRQYGRFFVGTGLVYSEFDANVHVIEPFDIPIEWQDMISIDPGLSNPLSCHFYARDYDDNVYVVGEYYMANKDIDFHAEMIHGLANRLNWKRDAKGKLSSLIDSAANQKTLASTKSVAELFADKGILVNTHVNKELYAGINKVKSMLKNRKLFIFKNCTELIREIKGYWWGDKDRPIKKDDHALDELRYYIMSNTTRPPKPLPKPTMIQQDKQNLIKKRKAIFY